MQLDDFATELQCEEVYIQDPLELEEIQELLYSTKTTSEER